LLLEPFLAPWSILRRRLNSARSTIRFKIFLAFSILAATTGALGLYAIGSVDESGQLVVATYDKPLMSTSYARLALSNFMAMELSLSSSATARADEGRSLDELADEVAQDLSVAEERASSRKAAGLARHTAEAVAEWHQLVGQRANPAMRFAIEEHSRQIIADFDSLVEVTAEDGFRERERALSTIHFYRWLVLGATILVLVLGGGVAIVLSRRMIHPIAVASDAARRIAAGELDVEIAQAAEDELGQLLRSMAIMRDNIRAMVEREIAARRSAQAALVSAIEGCEEGVVLLDADGRILTANSQLTRFFPEGPSFVAGEGLPIALIEAFTESRHELEVAGGRWLRLSRSATNDGGYVIIASDITALKEREAALKQAKEDAEAANNAKSQFLANMSHELRTPLNAVIGFSEIIAGEMMGPVGQAKYKEFANDILTSGRHLLELINDVLDCAKLQSGKMALRLEPTSIGDVVDAAVRMVHNEAESAGIRLTCQIDPDIGPITADPIRLRQVLLNLLSNSIKFTPAHGLIAVTVWQSGEIVRVAVSDTGIGMASADIPKALEPFTQIEESLARKHGGTGLGLALTKMLVESHGGTLTIESTRGVGTTVSFTLPAPGAAAKTAPKAASGGSWALAG
jgi:signal transduction histidine kinase/HAMP domain-containing protein